MIKFVYDERVRIDSHSATQPDIVRLGPEFFKLDPRQQVLMLNNANVYRKALKAANKQAKAKAKSPADALKLEIPRGAVPNADACPPAPLDPMTVICSLTPPASAEGRRAVWAIVLENVDESTVKTALAYALKFPTHEIPRMLADLLARPSGGLILNDPKFARWTLNNREAIQAYSMKDEVQP